MKKVFFFITAILFSVVVSAQIDLTGNWKLNTSKSTLGDQISLAPQKMVVSQKGNSLGIERHSEYQGQEFTTNDKFTLDGKECVNKGWSDSNKKSTANWSSDKKSLKIVSKISTQDGDDVTITENYKLDGGSMVVELSASSSFGDMEEKQVYDKIKKTFTQNKWGRDNL